MLAGSAGPPVGVNAVEITEAVQVVGPPRWSDTTTVPSEPDIVLEVVDAICVPSETAAVGALIERVPDVNVNDAGVEALAGSTMPIATATAMERRRTIFRVMWRLIGFFEICATNGTLESPERLRIRSGSDLDFTIHAQNACC